MRVHRVRHRPDRRAAIDAANVCVRHLDEREPARIKQRGLLLSVAESTARKELDLRRGLVEKLPQQVAIFVRAIFVRADADLSRSLVEEQLGPMSHQGSIGGMASTKSPAVLSDPQTPRYRDLYPFAGLLVAVICIAAGVALFLIRAVGQADWEGTLIWIHMRVNTQAPGIICLVVAAIVVCLTRPKRS